MRFDNMLERVLDRRGVRIGDGRAQTLPPQPPNTAETLLSALKVRSSPAERFSLPAFWVSFSPSGEKPSHRR